MLKNSVLLYSIAFLFAFHSISTNGTEINSLLGSEDLNFEALERAQGPALGSAIGDPRPWATYNQWMCFEADQVSSEDVEIDRSDGWKPWPQLKVEALGQVFHFSPESDLAIDAQMVRAAWQNQLQGSREVCFLAAFLQYCSSEEFEKPESVWIINTIKTERDYWLASEAESEFPES